MVIDVLSDTRVGGHVFLRPDDVVPFVAPGSVQLFMPSAALSEERRPRTWHYTFQCDEKPSSQTVEAAPIESAEKVNAV